MSSKAFYKSNINPKLIGQWLHNNNSTTNSTSTTYRSIEVWVTTCIVTNFGKTRVNDTNCSILINPCNSSLTGVANFPYFPRGGPVPNVKPVSMHKDWQPLGYVSTWGGMEVGSGMLYPVSVIDGLVHQLGGWKLQLECTMKRTISSCSNSTTTEPCPIGTAICTTLGCNELLLQYDSIIHTTPPFYKYDPNPVEMLTNCYNNSYQLIFNNQSENNTNNSNNQQQQQQEVHTRPAVRVAVPLLGSGARGFPYDVAIDVAATTSTRWMMSQASTRTPAGDDSITAIIIPNNQSLVFGVLEESIAYQLCNAIKDNINSLPKTTTTTTTTTTESVTTLK